jgi:DNA-binding NarL/FixJ family response regulator
MSNKIRVLLADDHTVLRAGLRSLISHETDMEVVGEAGDGQESLAKAMELEPDVVVMDIAMPKANGLDAISALRRGGVKSKIVVLTMYSEEQYLMQVLRRGGNGYVLKRSADTELMQAIRTVHAGGVFLYPSAARLLVDDRASDDGEGAGLDLLTQREREVLKLTVEGYTNQEIATRLIISVKTVDTYRSRIMEKLNLRHRSELVRYALRKGLLAPS